MAAPTSTQSPLRFPLPEPASPPAGRGLVPLAGTTPPGGRALVPTGGAGVPPGKAMVPYSPPASAGAGVPPAGTAASPAARGLGSRVLGIGGQLLRTGPVGAVMSAHYTATHPDNVRRVMAEQMAPLHEPVKVRYTDGVPTQQQLRESVKVRPADGVPTQQQLGGPSPAAEPASIAGFQQKLATAGARSSAALPGLRMAAQQEALRLGEPDPTAPADARTAAPPAAPTITMDQAFEQLRRGNAPGGGFEQQARFSGPTHSVFSRANPNNPGGTDPTVSKNEYIGVGAPEDPSVVAARAEQQARQSMLRQLTSAMGNSGNGGAAPAPRSNAYAINKRFDQLAERFGNMYGSRGQGNLARRLSELESQRASALANDAQIQSGLRGQDINAASNAANTRADMLRTAVGMMNNDAQIRASALASQPKPVTPAEAEKARRAAAETGMDNLREMAKSRFPDDPAKAEAAIAYMQSAPTELFGDLWSEDATARAASFEDMLKRFELSGYLNAGQNRVLGNESGVYDGLAEERDVKIEDLWNGGMHPIDWAQAMSPIGLSGHSRVLRTDAGRVVQKSEMPDDLAYQKVISDELRAAPARRALRDANRR